MPFSWIIGSTEQVAQLACDYSRSYILMGSTQLVNNSYLAIQKHSLSKALFDLRRACRESRLYELEIDKAIKRFYQTIELCKKYSLGNCYEMALIALDYVVHFAPQVDAEMYYISGGDHVFLVIGKEKNSHPKKPETWGNNAYICDPWANEVYSVSQYRARTKNFYQTVDSQSGTYINHIQDFNPLKHSLSPIKYANTYYIRLSLSEEHLKKIVKFFEEKNTYILNAMNFLEGRLMVIANRLIEKYGKNDEKSVVISKVMVQLQNSTTIIRESVNKDYNLSNYKKLRDTLESSLNQNVNVCVKAMNINQKDNDALYQYHNKNTLGTCILQFFNIPPFTARSTKEALQTTRDEVQRILHEDRNTWSIK